MNSINERIKEVRERLGISAQVMAKRLCVPTAHLENIESGCYAPSSTLVRLICREYEIPEDWLFLGQGSGIQAEPACEEPFGKVALTTPEYLQETVLLDKLLDGHFADERTMETQAMHDAESELTDTLELMMGTRLNGDAIEILRNTLFSVCTEEFATGYKVGIRDGVQFLIESLTVGTGMAVHGEAVLSLAAQAAKDYGKAKEGEL